VVYLDVVCLNYDGGVLDAAVLACVGALKNREHPRDARFTPPLTTVFMQSSSPRPFGTLTTGRRRACPSRQHPLGELSLLVPSRSVFPLESSTGAYPSSGSRYHSSDSSFVAGIYSQTQLSSNLNSAHLTSPSPSPLPPYHRAEQISCTCTRQVHRCRLLELSARGRILSSSVSRWHESEQENSRLSSRADYATWSY
jgi:hypothetical protein